MWPAAQCGRHCCIRQPQQGISVCFYYNFKLYRMNLITTALRKPIAIIVLVSGLVLFGVIAVRKINIDIFPSLSIPTIYVSQPYGGLSPQQMEGFVSTNYQNIYLYINGIKSIETNNIQGLSLLKLSFYDGTDMAQAAAE